MTVDTIKQLVWNLVLLLAQVIVLNNIHLFGCATPLLLVYIILVLPVSTPRWLVLVASFFLGITSDIFSNTPGVAASAMTLIGFTQPMFLSLFLSREAPENMRPSLRSLGPAKYLIYILTMVFLYSLVFYSLEEFNFFHLQQWAMLIAGSTILTCILIFTIESLRKD